MENNRQVQEVSVFQTNSIDNIKKNANWVDIWKISQILYDKSRTGILVRKHTGRPERRSTGRRCRSSCSAPRRARMSPRGSWSSGEISDRSSKSHSIRTTNRTYSFSYFRIFFPGISSFIFSFASAEKHEAGSSSLYLSSLIRTTRDCLRILVVSRSVANRRF